MKFLFYFLFFVLGSCSSRKKVESNSEISKDEKKVISREEPIISSNLNHETKSIVEVMPKFERSPLALSPVIGKKIYVKQEVMPKPPAGFKEEYFYFRYKDYPEYMEKWGWHIGDKITWIHYATGIVTEYVFHENSKFMKDYSSFYLYGNEKDNPEEFALGIFVVLEDDKNKLNTNVQQELSAAPLGEGERWGFIRGVAYWGAKSVSPFQQGQVILPQWKKADKYQDRTFDDYIQRSRLPLKYFTYELSNFNNIEIVKPNFSHDKLDEFESCNCVYGVYFNYKNQLYPLRPLAGEPQYSANPGMNLKVGNFIKGAEAVFTYQDEGMHSCGGLVIFYKDRVEEVRLDCDSGGC